MKRFFLLLLVSLLASMPALAENQLVMHAVTLARQMDALAGNETCLRVMSLSKKIATHVMTWAEGDHDQPRLIVLADATEALVAMRQELMQQEGIPEEMIDRLLYHQNVLTLPQRLAARQGAETLAAVSSVQTGMLLAEPEAAGAGVFILLYEAAVPVLVSWYAQNGAVSMSAMFVPDEGLAAQTSARAVEVWLKSNAYAFSCTEILLP